MKILITNDDGWDAPGIAALLEVARDWGECTVVAPASEQSGVSHKMTIFGSVELKKQDEHVWSLDGTPADCVRIGLTQLNFDFDLVLSGINNGGNLGSDIYVSGTFAAAREAALFGLPAIAISQHRLKFAEVFDWSPSKILCRKAVEHCMGSGLTKREVINVNLPDVSDSGPSMTEISIFDPCPLDPAPRIARYSATKTPDSAVYTSIGKYNQREQTPKHDVATCFAKQIPITRLRF